MVYLLADGKMVSKSFIEETYTFLDAIKWLQLRIYENYITGEIIKKHRG